MITYINKIKNGLFERLDSLLGVCAMLILVVYALFALLIQSIFPHIFDKNSSLVPSINGLVNVFSDKMNFLAVYNSFTIGIMATIIAVVLGIFAAVAVKNMGRRLSKVTNALIWITFFMPSYVITQGWIISLQDGGIISQIFKLQSGWSKIFFTRYGVAIIMGLRFFTYVYFGLQQALMNIGDELIKAGKIAGASKFKRFFKITLPLLTPAILAGASIAFAEGFGDFGIAAAITPNSHIPLLTYQIYSSLNQDPVDYSNAACLSVIEIMVTTIAILLQFAIMRKKSYITNPVVKSKDKASENNKNHPVLITGIVILLLFSLALPLVSNVIASFWKVWANGISSTNWTLANYNKVMSLNSDGYNSIIRSIFYSILVTIIALPFALTVAYQLVFKKTKVSKFINVLNMSTIAIPGVVMAAGFVFAWNAVWLIPLNLVLYGTPICLGMAYLAGALPYSIRLQTGALSTLPTNLIKSAKIFGANNSQIIFRIIVPLVSTTTISTFFMSFSGIMFELPAASLLYPAGQPPFSVVIQSEFNNSNWSKGSALTIVGILIVFVVFIITKLLIWLINGKGINKVVKVNEIEIKETKTIIKPQPGISSIEQN